MNCKPYVIPGLAHQQVKVPVLITGKRIPDPDFFKLRGPLTMRIIQDIVAADYGLTTDELIYGNNSPGYSLPRMVSMYMCARHLREENLYDIATAHNKDNHSSTIYSRRKVEGFMDVYPELRERIEKLNSEIKAYKKATGMFPGRWRHKR